MSMTLCLLLSLLVCAAATPAPPPTALQVLASSLQGLVLRTVVTCPRAVGWGAAGGGPGLCPLLGERGHARAYYGGPAYHTYVSAFEPMTMLAGLAFLAFLLQTLHALLYRNPPGAALSPVALAREGKAEQGSVLAALAKYEELGHNDDDDTREQQERGLPWLWPSCVNNAVCRWLRRAAPPS